MELIMSQLSTMLANLPQSKHATKDALAAVASGGSWIPRLQLYISSSELCKAGKFPVNNYGLVRSRAVIDNLTGEVNVIPLAWRPKAADIKNGVNYYDHKSDSFRTIQEKSQTFGNNCMCGPEILVWIPVAKSFATFFMASTTAQGEAPNLIGLIGKPATLKVQPIQSKKYGTYYAPLVVACSESLDEPDQESFGTTIDKFCNPKESELEAAEPQEEDAR
jgi:hypothetical protein